MDTIIDKPDKPLKGWSILEHDASGGRLMRWFAHAVYILRKVSGPAWDNCYSPYFSSSAARAQTALDRHLDNVSALYVLIHMVVLNAKPVDDELLHSDSTSKVCSYRAS